jgi:hypothetical protein
MKCASGAICKGNGQSCIADVECCNNSCLVGMCTGTSSCLLLGEVCSGGQCCSGQCLGSHCTFYNYCRADGEYCDQNSDCCNNICLTSTKRCAVTSGACVPTHQPCSGVRSCCNTMCVDVGLVAGVGYCYPIGGCKTYMDICTKDQDCCSLKCGAPDPKAGGMRRCERYGNCLPPGDVCGGLGASQNCCDGGKAICQKTSTGVSRCWPNYGGACFPDGAECHMSDECCSHLCLPDSTSSTGFRCGAQCIPLGSGTCTTDADCCSPGVCQNGVCLEGGSTCVPLGGPCLITSDCCIGICQGGFCAAPG